MRRTSAVSQMTASTIPSKTPPSKNHGQTYRGLRGSNWAFDIWPDYLSRSARSTTGNSRIDHLSQTPMDGCEQRRPQARKLPGWNNRERAELVGYDFSVDFSKREYLAGRLATRCGWSSTQSRSVSAEEFSHVRSEPARRAYSRAATSSVRTGSSLHREIDSPARFAGRDCLSQWVCPRPHSG